MKLTKIVQSVILAVVVVITVGCGDPTSGEAKALPEKKSVAPGDLNAVVTTADPLPSEFALIGPPTKLNDYDVCYVIEYLPTKQRYMVVRSIVFGRRWEQSDVVSLSVTHLTSSEVRR